MNIKTLDLNLLKALDALLDEKSVTRAARQLGLSQPAVSGILARLRETFDDPLFIRTQRGLLPTPRAEALALPVKEALSRVEALIAPEHFAPEKAELTLKIAATDYAQQVLLLPLLKALRTEAPGIRLSISPVDTSRFANQLEKGHLDLALTTPDMGPDTLKATKLFDESYVCVLRQGHPALQNGTLDLERFCQLDHAIMSHDGTSFRGATDDALAEHGLTRNVVAALPSFMVLLDLIRTTDMCTLLPRRLLQDQSGITTAEPPLTVKGFTKIVCWHERTHYDPAHIWLRRKLTTLAMQTSSP